MPSREATKRLWKLGGNEMKALFKRCLSVLLTAVLLLSLPLSLTAVESEGEGGVDLTPFTVDAASAVLMDVKTGTILFAQNPDQALPPASVTKVMTLLLVMEAIDEGKIRFEDIVTASEKATSMGGSQIYLKVGEQMSVEDLVKSVVIASANDAALALAEHISGSEEAFVKRMNERAEELGMRNTHFENTNGLDDTTTNHVTSARDIAIMSCELLKHEQILRFTTTWMDSIRDGAFGLTNTNRLVRFYPGATGLKTGSTSKAKFCISASAERDGLHLVAVIMASPTRDIRNEEAKKLLDYGFANYASYTDEGGAVGQLPVLSGVKDKCDISYQKLNLLVDKAQAKNVRKEIVVKDKLKAPVLKGEVVGEVGYYIGDEKVGAAQIVADESVDKISFGTFFLRMLKSFFLA